MSRRAKWEQPEELTELLSILTESANGTGSGHLLLVCEDEGAMRIPYRDACKILATVESVRRFAEALDYPDGVDVEVQGFELDGDVLAELEDSFSFVEVL